MLEVIADVPYGDAAIKDVNELIKPSLSAVSTSVDGSERLLENELLRHLFDLIGASGITEDGWLFCSRVVDSSYRQREAQTDSETEMDSEASGASASAQRGPVQLHDLQNNGQDECWVVSQVLYDRGYPFTRPPGDPTRTVPVQAVTSSCSSQDTVFSNIPLTPPSTPVLKSVQVYHKQACMSDDSLAMRLEEASSLLQVYTSHAAHQSSSPVNSHSSTLESPSRMSAGMLLKSERSSSHSSIVNVAKQVDGYADAHPGSAVTFCTLTGAVKDGDEEHNAYHQHGDQRLLEVEG
ncbi:uncharacterized protein EKO05_0001810 [Ascochyta rabiei]|uniref:uncharacterized protein n=1 Tax=Didymella rabiei TaxID=5454 RepID=UPI001901795A|nr:uncharacterized protein EKO05_0001810 [Ascochyta rabiei]UPX11188.1 hypothetical protein EKO05_0001810 [Ascochyta rabiei]